MQLDSPRYPRLLRLPEVLARTSLKKPTLYRALRERKFPKPCKILNARGSAWDEREVSAWIEERLASRTRSPAVRGRRPSSAPDARR